MAGVVPCLKMAVVLQTVQIEALGIVTKLQRVRRRARQETISHREDSLGWCHLEDWCCYYEDQSSALEETASLNAAAPRFVRRESLELVSSASIET